MDKGDSNIILFPDTEKLRERHGQLRAELSMLLFERDELALVICKNIEMAYCLKFAALERSICEAECRMRRLRCKLELIRAKKNRGEEVCLSAIEAELDREFAEYSVLLEEKIRQMNDALERSQSEVLSEEQTAELKKLYRDIVKRLHPDLNPDLTEAEAALFPKAVTAYENGDSETVRVIWEMICGQEVSGEEEAAPVALARENKRLEELLAVIREKICEIKNRYPYTFKEIVEQPDKEAAYRQKLEDILLQYREGITIYEEKLKELLR